MQKIKQVFSNDSDSTSRHGSTAESAGADPRMSTGGNEQLPVQSGVHGRAEETGPKTSVKGDTPGFRDPHSLGHERDHNLANKFDLNAAAHDHKHIGHVSHDHHHKHQTEEVTREKTHERHIHHTQIHHQPVHDTQHHEAVHREQMHPQTKIHETHGSTKQDIAAFGGLAAKHKDEQHDHGTERVVVDKGENVQEQVHHHVHNVVQPILKTDHHHHEVIHTTIPTHHVSHEAPIVHEAITAKPVSKSDFLAKGGVLDSKLHHSDQSIMNEGGCDRQVDGVGEQLAQKLGLKSGTTAHEHKADTRI